MPRSEGQIRDNRVMNEDQSDAPALAPEDFYMEGAYMVFTEAYLLKRGYCCGSHCRHCPYGLAPGAESNQRSDPEGAAPPAEG